MTTKREPRWWFVAYSAGLGVVAGAAAVAGGRPPSFAAFSVVLLTSFGVVMASTPYGRLRAASQDERERSVGLEAAGVAGVALIVVILIAFVIDLARGGSGMPWAWLAGVGGAAYLVALGVLNARR